MYPTLDHDGLALAHPVQRLVQPLSRHVHCDMCGPLISDSLNSDHTALVVIGAMYAYDWAAENLGRTTG